MWTRYLAAGIALLSAGRVDGAQGALSGGVTATVFAAEGGRADPSGAASFDLILEHPSSNGAWIVHLEGSTSVNPGTVAAVFPDANADAGTATADGSEGTVQVSEIQYRRDLAQGSALSLGVLDVTGYVDVSNTANDENTQFLNAALVNNPSIEFPDYTFGLVFEKALRAAHLIGVVSSSHGFADNGDNSYTKVLDVSADGKGTFGLAAVRFGEAMSTELGIWGSSADHATLDGNHTDRANYGAYGVFGGAFNGMSFDLRAGYADPQVTEANLFAAASLAFELEEASLGIGYARSALAQDAKGPDRDASSVAEVYLRIPFGAIEVTADLQHLQNPQFDATVPDTRVAGIRLHRAF